MMGTIVVICIYLFVIFEVLYLGFGTSPKSEKSLQFLRVKIKLWFYVNRKDFWTVRLAEYKAKIEMLFSEHQNAPSRIQWGLDNKIHRMSRKAAKATGKVIRYKTKISQLDLPK